MEHTPVELILSIGSFGITAYFWLVQARRERPQLRIFQISGFRAVCRRHQQRDDAKRLCVQQLDSCGVLKPAESSFPPKRRPTKRAVFPRPKAAQSTTSAYRVPVASCFANVARGEDARSDSEG